MRLLSDSFDYEMVIRNFSESKKLASNKKAKISAWYIIKLFFSSLYFIFNLKRTDVIFLSDSSSRINVDGNYKDPIMDRLSDQENAENKIIEFPIFGASVHNRHSYNKDKIVPGSIFYLIEFSVYCLLKITKNSKHDFPEELSEKYDVSKTDIDDLITRFKSKYLSWKIIHTYFGFKKVYIKSSYSLSCMALISFCKDKSIVIYEVQHSHIYPNHFGYSSEGVENIDNLLYFRPDGIICFSERYKEFLTNNYWIVLDTYIGNPYTQNFSMIKSRANSSYSLIISQFNLKEEIANYILNSDLVDVVIKCHPRGIDEYEFYISKFLHHPKVSIVKDELLSDLCLGAVNVYGVYSSGLIDALHIREKKGLNYEIFILPILGNEKMSDFIENGDFKKIG